MKRMTAPPRVVVAVLNGEEESSWVLDEMEVVVYRLCLQRPKDVVFEGLSSEGLVMKLENDEEDEEEM